MSKRLHQLTLQHQSVHEQIEAELRKLRSGCQHKDVVRTDASNGRFLFMCLRCRSEEHGYYLHHMRFAHAYQLPEIPNATFYDLRPPGDLFLCGRDDVE